VAVVIQPVTYSRTMEVSYLRRLNWGGLHGKHAVVTWKELGTIPAFASTTQENQENLSGWPVAGPSRFWLLASRPASKSSSPLSP
jgi:hypothetical protein